MDDADSEPLRVLRIADRHRLSADLYSGGIRDGRAREDARERALTRPVFSDKRVNLAAPQRKMGVPQSAYAAVMLGYVLGVQECVDAASIQNPINPSRRFAAPLCEPSALSNTFPSLSPTRRWTTAPRVTGRPLPV